MIDTGGTGKGLCADAVAMRHRRLHPLPGDCGGDIAVGGVGAQLEPFEIAVEHPLTGEPLGTVDLPRGGIATSGLNVRIWRNPDGRTPTTCSTRRPARRHGPGWSESPRWARMRSRPRR